MSVQWSDVYWSGQCSQQPTATLRAPQVVALSHFTFSEKISGISIP